MDAMNKAVRGHIRRYSILKGLSYEIDFKNVDKNGQILALMKVATRFQFFRGSSDFSKTCNAFFSVNEKVRQKLMFSD
jgi:hypothetical protein